ncbi:F-box domain-containing protein [Plasmodiophora brassicae]
MKCSEVIVVVTAAAVLIVARASSEPPIVRQPTEQGDAPSQPPEPIAGDGLQVLHAGATTNSDDSMLPNLPDDIIRNIVHYGGKQDNLRMRATSPAWNEVALGLLGIDNLCRDFVQRRHLKAASHPRCRAVVNDIFRSTQTPGWLDMMPFLVQCGANTSLVTDLDLSHNELTSIPAEIGQLTSLKELNLAGNYLRSIPAEIGQLTSLKTLYLLYNHDLRSIPPEIGQLTSLETLSLAVNRLQSIPAEIGQLTSLKDLDLRDNELRSIPAEIGQLTSLVELMVQNNKLESLPAEMGQLTSLEHL